MSYFSSNTTWLSLTAEDRLSTLDWRERFGPDGRFRRYSLDETSPRSRKSRRTPTQRRQKNQDLFTPEENQRACLHCRKAKVALEGGEKARALAELGRARDLWHGLVMYQGQWSFGPELLECTIKMARLQDDCEEALIHYCHARFVAKRLVEEQDRVELLLTWLELDLLIAEILGLMGSHESAELYAREGLKTLKANKFREELAPRITHLVMRFLEVMGRH